VALWRAVRPWRYCRRPFVYNLLSILDSWQPRPHLQRWYQQISQRPAWREVVQIPVT
jgi:glutathione S-transferase